MTGIVDRAVEVLRRAGVELDRGLTEAEVVAVEARYGFRFCDEHRDLVRRVLPVGKKWPDWRHGGPSVTERLAWPAEGVLFDVRVNGFWASSWGPRPGDADEAVEVARQRLATVHGLVPLYGHRYLPAAPSPSPAPVLSVYQTDVVYYGDDLADWAAAELEGKRSLGTPAVRVPFWSDLVEDP